MDRMFSAIKSRNLSPHYSTDKGWAYSKRRTKLEVVKYLEMMRVIKELILNIVPFSFHVRQSESR